MVLMLHKKRLSIRTIYELPYEAMMLRFLRLPVEQSVTWPDLEVPLLLSWLRLR